MQQAEYKISKKLFWPTCIMNSIKPQHKIYSYM